MKKRRRKRKKIIIPIIILGFILIFVAAAEYTSHSKFCASCHYMKTFYRSWQLSKHNKIECATCHYPPGLKSRIEGKLLGLMQIAKYWTKLYLKSKPWAEIPDESCLRHGCHEKRLLEGRVKFKKVVFDHKIHLTDLKRGKRLRCTSCHSQIVQGEHISVTESTCFICHFKKSEHYPRIADCSHCHHKEALISETTSRFNHSIVFDKGFDCNKCHSHTIVGDGEVPRENCYKCHWETDRLNKYEDTDLIHYSHIFVHKIECNQCHLAIQHKIVKDIETISDCQTCHPDYHKPQKFLFLGEGGKGVPHPTPNIMFEKGLSCKGCHIFHEESGGRLIKSETLVSKAQACESCHGRGFARIMKDWEISTDKKLNKIRAIYQKASQDLMQTKNAQKQKAQRLLEEAAFDIDIVERGKAVHNVSYSQELLSASYNKVVEALRLTDSSYKPESFLGVSKEIPTQCSTCHAGIEEINRQVFGLNFPHQKHLIEQKIQCTTCHSNVRKHGEFIATKRSCAVCHHKDTKKDCTGCHQLQKTFYEGGQLEGFNIPKDIMAEAEASCVDCHLNSRNQIFRPDSNKCLDCHDEDYGAIFIEWQNSVKTILGAIKTSLTEKKKLKLNDEEKAQVLNIEKTIKNIELDGSSGVHNYQFIEETLRSLKKKLESITKNP